MKKYLPRYSLILIPLLIYFIGPWPILDDHYLETDYAQNTLQGIQNLSVENNTGELKVSVSTVDITPPLGVPLGGYSARKPKSNEGILHRVFAKAITFSNGLDSITFVSPEILLPMPELAQSIVKKTGLERKQIFFAATHTHSGPGAFANGFISSMALGDFNEEQFNFLSDRISQAIIESRQNLVNAEIHYRRIMLSDSFSQQLIRDQLNSPGEPHNSLHLLEVFERNSTNRIATLFTFSAHPTFLGRRNKLVSGDYPGLVMQALEKELPGTIIFAAGAAGGMLPHGIDKSPATKVEAERQKLDDMGKRFTLFLSKTLKNAESYNEEEVQSIEHWNGNNIVLQSEVVTVKLPDAIYRLTDHLRLSPYIVEQLFHNGDTYVHALRLGKIFFIGYPADYSGESAQALEQWANDKQVYPWATSFNGDYVGYIMPTKHYDKSHYTVRDVNFYGKWAGDYFTELSQNTINKFFQNEQ